MKWYWSNTDPAAEPGFKSHATPERLHEMIMADLRARGAVGLKSMVITEPVGIELGGMCMDGRHERILMVDDLSIQVPSGHVSGLLMIAEAARLREELSTPYYKLHYWFSRCLVLTPEQHTIWVAQLRGCLAECEAIESAENDEFNRRFSENPHPGVRVRERPVKKPVGRG
jgi:hypothetical protein